MSTNESLLIPYVCYTSAGDRLDGERVVMIKLMYSSSLSFTLDHSSMTCFGSETDDSDTLSSVSNSLIKQETTVKAEVAAEGDHVTKKEVIHTTTTTTTTPDTSAFVPGVWKNGELTFSVCKTEVDFTSTSSSSSSSSSMSQHESRLTNAVESCDAEAIRAAYDQMPFKNKLELELKELQAQQRQLLSSSSSTEEVSVAKMSPSQHFILAVYVAICQKRQRDKHAAKLREKYASRPAYAQQAIDTAHLATLPIAQSTTRTTVNPDFLVYKITPLNCKYESIPDGFFAKIGQQLDRLCRRYVNLVKDVKLSSYCDLPVEFVTEHFHDAVVRTSDKQLRLYCYLSDTVKMMRDRLQSLFPNYVGGHSAKLKFGVAVPPDSPWNCDNSTLKQCGCNGVYRFKLQLCNSFILIQEDHPDASGKPPTRWVYQYVSRSINKSTSVTGHYLYNKIAGVVGAPSDTFELHSTSSHDGQKLITKESLLSEQNVGLFVQLVRIQSATSMPYHRSPSSLTIWTKPTREGVPMYLSGVNLLLWCTHSMHTACAKVESQEAAYTKSIETGKPVYFIAGDSSSKRKMAQTNICMDTVSGVNHTSRIINNPKLKAAVAKADNEKWDCSCLSGWTPIEQAKYDDILACRHCYEVTEAVALDVLTPVAISELSYYEQRDLKIREENFRKRTRLAHSSSSSSPSQTFIPVSNQSWSINPYADGYNMEYLSHASCSDAIYYHCKKCGSEMERRQRFVNPIHESAEVRNAKMVEENKAETRRLKQTVNKSGANPVLNDSNMRLAQQGEATSRSIDALDALPITQHPMFKMMEIQLNLFIEGIPDVYKLYTPGMLSHLRTKAYQLMRGETERIAKIDFNKHKLAISIMVYVYAASKLLVKAEQPVSNTPPDYSYLLCFNVLWKVTPKSSCDSLKHNAIMYKSSSSSSAFESKPKKLNKSASSSSSSSSSGGSATKSQTDDKKSFEERLDQFVAEMDKVNGVPCTKNGETGYYRKTLIKDNIEHTAVYMQRLVCNQAVLLLSNPLTRGKLTHKDVETEEQAITYFDPAQYSIKADNGVLCATLLSHIKQKSLCSFALALLKHAHPTAIRMNQCAGKDNPASSTMTNLLATIDKIRTTHTVEQKHGDNDAIQIETN